MKILLLALVSVAASGAGQLLLRHGAMAAAGDLDGRAYLALLLSPPVLAGLAAWALSTALWLLVLTRAELSFVYLLGSLNYIAVPLLSRWLFNERVGTTQLAGMLVITCGVALTLAGRGAERGAP